jgi:hypothetical protein
MRVFDHSPAGQIWRPAGLSWQRIPPANTTLLGASRQHSFAFKNFYDGRTKIKAGDV